MNTHTKLRSMGLLLSTFSLVMSATAKVASPAIDKTFKSEDYVLVLEDLTIQSGSIWGFDFLNDDEIIFTERSGALKVLSIKNKSVRVIKGAPTVWAQRQGGLLDVRVAPVVAMRGAQEPETSAATKSREIFLTYSKPIFDSQQRPQSTARRATTALARADLVGSELKNFKELFVAKEASDEGIHFGSRIEFGDAQTLFITVGDRNARKNSQSLEYHTGKVIRLNRDGSVPADNPYVGQDKALPEIWSIGHRSPQGLVRDERTGILWLTEMGPRGGDELNKIEPGKNYGWPDVTYGREYWGPKIGVTEKVGTIQPVTHWVPSISPSGTTIYYGEVFKKWEGQIFIANLSGHHLRRLRLQNDKVIEQEEILKDLNERLRNVRVGSDGLIYVSTDAGRIFRLHKVK